MPGVQPDQLASGGVVECPHPSPDLVRFDARYRGADEPTVGIGSLAPRTHPITMENLLLQGVFLRSAEPVVGLAIYTGNETKLGKNKRPPPRKLSRMDRFADRLVLVAFCVQVGS